MRKVEKFLKALANRRRLHVLKFLAKGDSASLGEVSREIGLAFRSASKHLRILQEAGLIERGQRSKYAEFYLTSKPPYKHLLDNILKQL